MTAAPAAPLLEAHRLSFHRQDEPVFAPLDFRLHAGELALVEGDNGSGKTTLLRLLAGLLHASEGRLLWRGEPWQREVCAGEILFLLLWMWAATGLVGAFFGAFFGVLWAIFHILIVLLQAYIFMMLTIVYVSMAHEHH